MRLLVDANLSPRIAQRLCTVGHEATHVMDHGMTAAPDSEIADFAVREGCVIVSADSDFASMLALGGGLAPSLVLLRSVDRLPSMRQADLLIANLPGVEADLRDGAVVTISRTHLRVRRLPIRE